MNTLQGLAAATALVAMAGVANATTITQDREFVGDQTLTFDGFDTSLGTLTGVSATIDGTATLGDFIIRGEGIFAEDFDVYIFFAEYEGSATLSLGGGLVVDASFSKIASCDHGEDPKYCDDFGGAERDFSEDGTADDLAAFTGGPISGTVEFSTFFGLVVGEFLGFVDDFDQGGGIVDGLDTSWTGSGKVTLTYTFDPTPPPAVIPLPAALPLMLGGLGALFAVGLRRKRRG